jgi:hypothetical protein
VASQPKAKFEVQQRRNFGVASLAVADSNHVACFLQIVCVSVIFVCAEQNSLSLSRSLSLHFAASSLSIQSLLNLISPTEICFHKSREIHHIYTTTYTTTNMSQCASCVVRSKFPANYSTLYLWWFHIIILGACSLLLTCVGSSSSHFFRVYAFGCLWIMVYVRCFMTLFFSWHYIHCFQHYIIDSNSSRIFWVPRLLLCVPPGLYAFLACNRSTGFFFPNLGGRWVGIHPQEDLARFGYTSDRTVEKFRFDAIVWRHATTYCLNMATSKRFSS